MKKNIILWNSIKVGVGVSTIVFIVLLATKFLYKSDHKTPNNVNATSSSYQSDNDIGGGGSIPVEIPIEVLTGDGFSGNGVSGSRDGCGNMYTEKIIRYNPDGTYYSVYRDITHGYIEIKYEDFLLGIKLDSTPASTKRYNY